MNGKVALRSNTYIDPSSTSQSSSPELHHLIRSATTVSAQEEPQEESLDQCFLSFISDIRNEIIINRDLYGQFLEVKEITIILEQFQKRYIDHEEACQIVRLILDFLVFCKKKNGNLIDLQTPFQGDYKSVFASKWQKIRQAIYFQNKGHLRILSYTVKEPIKKVQSYGICFQKLNFDFSMEETKALASVVKFMCRQDIRAFCFLSNYLLKCCFCLQKTNKNIAFIQERYTEVLANLSEINRPAPPIEAEDGQFGIHQNINHKALIPNFQINLQEYSTKEQKEFALDTFIMSRAEDSIRQFDRFSTMMKDICYNNDGFRFKSGVKIKNKEQKKELRRIKQKMLSEIFSLVQLEQKLAPHFNGAILDFVDIYSFSQQEQNIFLQKMTKILHSVTQPIKFKITDMLRAKCMFTSIDKINNCCSEIIAAIKKEEGKGLKLIQIDNRLRKGTSDLVLKVLFGNVVAELQLVIHLNSSEYEFSHKLYELQRSKFFTPLTQLYIQNEELSRDYFLQVKAVIMANIRKEDHDYQESVTYQQVFQNFKAFSFSLPIKINLFEVHPNEIDVRMMEKQQSKLKKIVKSGIERKQIEISLQQMVLNNAIYSFQLKNYKKTLDSLYSIKKSSEKVPGQDSHLQNDKKKSKKQQIYIKALGYQGKTYLEMGKYQQAEQKYQQKLKLEQQLKLDNSSSGAESMFQLGRINDRRGNYPQALDYYNKCLQIQKQVKGSKKEDIASTLNNIGSTLFNQGKYTSSLIQYKKCLQIQEEIKGKHSIEAALTLNNIGIVYSSQGNFNKALEYFERCLQIQQKVKGKGNIDLASTLNNIGSAYNDQCNYEKALEYYIRCLEIEERVKGKGNIDTSVTIRNIGLVYKNQNSYDKALQYFQKAIKIQQTVRGTETSDISLIYTNIGMVYDIQGKYEQALQYYQKSLTIQRNVLFQDTLDTSLNLHNLGILYMNRKNYQKSLQYLQKCLEIQQQVKGEGSLDTALTLSNIGLIYKYQNNSEEALKCCRQAMKIYQNYKIGSMNSASNLSNIGLILFDLKQFEEASQHFKRSIDLFQKLGDETKMQSNIEWLLRCFKNEETIQKISEIMQKYGTSQNYT